MLNKIIDGLATLGTLFEILDKLAILISIPTFIYLFYQNWGRAGLLFLLMICVFIHYANYYDNQFYQNKRMNKELDTLIYEVGELLLSKTFSDDVLISC